MTHEEATELIRGGVAAAGGSWADLGAGTGTFTRALADLIGEGGVVFAVDREDRVLQLDAFERRGSARIESRLADFTAPLDLPVMDGILMANALHFSPDPEAVLANVLARLRRGGTFLLVEYDLETGTHWIPYPVSRDRFGQLAPRVGLREPREVGRMPSRFGRRDIYAAVAEKQ